MKSGRGKGGRGRLGENCSERGQGKGRMKESEKGEETCFVHNFTSLQSDITHSAPSTPRTRKAYAFMYAIRSTHSARSASRRCSKFMRGSMRTRNFL